MKFLPGDNVRYQPRNLKDLDPGRKLLAGRRGKVVTAWPEQSRFLVFFDENATLWIEADDLALDETPPEQR
jgi:hypothetical protein